MCANEKHEVHCHQYLDHKNRPRSNSQLEIILSIAFHPILPHLFLHQPHPIVQKFEICDH